MITVLGFSDKDFHLALIWLRWVSWLCMKEGGASQDLTLVLFGTRRITTVQWDDLHRFHYHSECMFKLEPVVCRDERETGYPSSANHLFYRALKYCEAKYPTEPVLWAEADTVALRPGWAQAIDEEYRSCGKPFMGFRAQSLGPHMAGNGVYPFDWRKQAPCMDDILSLGEAWDTACSREIVPKMAVAKTIHQVWRPKKIDYRFVSMISKEAALFHQDKSGVMPGLLDSGFG